MHTGANRKSVAESAGVSEATVSRALSDSPLISAATREKVKKVAAELGYIPSQQAALFAKKKTLRIGFVVPSYKSFPPFSRAYFPTLLDGAVLGAEEKGYFVMAVIDKRDGVYKDLVHLVKSREVDGLLLAVTPVDDPRFMAMQDNNIPFVLVNNYSEGCNSVDAKPLRGMQKALEYALEMGHRKIGFVTGDMKFRNAQDRLNTFEQLAKQFGLEIAIAEGNFSRTSGYCCAGKLLQNEKPPTLIMTSSDREAIGVLDYCRDHKICVPNDISVIGYDNFDLAKDITPALTTVNNPVTRSGFLGAQVLIDIIENKKTETVNEWLDTDFVVRQSSGKSKQL